MDRRRSKSPRPSNLFLSAPSLIDPSVIRRPSLSPTRTETNRVQGPLSRTQEANRREPPHDPSVSSGSKTKPVRKSPGNRLKPAGTVPTRLSQIQKDTTRASFLEDVQAHETKTLKNSSVVPEEIGPAQRSFTLGQNKELTTEFLGVRSAVDILMQTVLRIEAKVSTIEQSREVVAPRRDMAAEDWLTNLVRHVEGQIWQSMERRVEEKVRAAVVRATEDVTSSVKELSEMLNSGRGKPSSSSRQRAGEAGKARSTVGDDQNFGVESNSDADSDSSGHGSKSSKRSGAGKGKESKHLAAKREFSQARDFGKTSSLFPEEAPGLLPETNHKLHIHLNEKRQSIQGSTVGKRASAKSSSRGELQGLKAKDEERLPAPKEDDTKSAPQKKVVPPTTKACIHVHKDEAIAAMLDGRDTSESMYAEIPQFLKEPQNWGIRVREIKKFYDYIKTDLDEYVSSQQAAGENVNANLHIVTPRYIKPWTAAFQPHPLAGVMNADQLCHLKVSSLEEFFTARIFISHCWNENFHDFVTTMNTILEGDDVVWVCAISICQNVDIQGILGDRIEDSPFWRAMPHCRRVAMLIDRKAEPFERAWCALEEYLATYKLRLPFSICMPEMDEEAWQEVDRKLQNFSIRDCKASEPSDLKKIMDIIEDKADIIDRVVRDESQKACFAARVMKLATSGTVQDLIPMAMQALTQVHDGAGRSILHICAQTNNADQLKGLLDHNLTSNQRDGSNKAPLHYASELGHIEVAKVLIAKKADVNAKDKLKASPLSLAAHHGQVAVVPLLIDAKAFPNSMDVEGLTPLMTACCETQGNVVSELIKCGANLKVKDFYGHSALTLAAQANSPSIVQTLLEGRADVNAQDDDGATPLMYAAGFGYKAVVIALLKGKADTMVMDRQEYTALNFAEEDNHEDIKQLLLASQQLS